ncbi:MAG: hypothetical protein LBS81_02450 [Endomicrobium sp.]|nr:hypothetical protein [Endomicrobium sp.]
MIQKISSDLIDFNFSAIEKVKILDLHINGYPVSIDTAAEKIFIDNYDFQF